jgi:CRISPR/Cas system CSM-associated protein Csm3 (group 7 of RAMP superfamily)
MSKITGKIIFKGTLMNLSPIIIGTGKGEDTNIEVVKGYNGSFYIPASSFIGVLRHYIDENYKSNGEFYRYFWGDGNYQSNFILEDILPAETCKIVVRDGVKIDNKKGITAEEEGAKFDYEVVEGEINLNLFGEIVFRKEFDKNDEFLRILATIKRDLENEEISVGAITTKGFGRLKLNNFEAFYFKFPGDGEKYLKFLASGKENVSELKVNFQDLGPFSKDNQNFIVEAAFSLKNSLIIGSNASGSDEVDKGHLKSNGKPILSGTSIKGAIRDRAVKIINTLKEDASGEDFIKETFGWVDNKAKSKEKYKSRVIVDESFIDESVTEETQTRIKIDRFTGGTISGALFKSKPIWHKD